LEDRKESIEAVEAAGRIIGDLVLSEKERTVVTGQLMLQALKDCLEAMQKLTIETMDRMTVKQAPEGLPEMLEALRREVMQRAVKRWTE
jgi:hypothetical protein